MDTLGWTSNVSSTRFGEPQVVLMNGFELRIDGRAVPVPLNAQRLLAFLALKGRCMVRAHAAGALWLDAPDATGAANLRSAVWRIKRLGHPLIDATRTHVRLAPGIAVDAVTVAEIARRLVGHVETLPSPPVNLHLAFSAGDLLPDWYADDGWLLMERICFRQLRLHALERLSRLLIHHGRFGEAVEAALAAVAADPLRESAQRAVISAYLAEGNSVEAVRQYDTFRMCLVEEMGAEPTRQMEELIAAAW